jgi:hypothetical protein
MTSGRIGAAALGLWAWTWAGAVQADAAGDKVLDCMRANIPTAVQIREVELTSTDRNGADRLLVGKVYATREDGRIRVLMRISRPRDLDGASYLMREGDGTRKDEIFMYLPAIQRVRKISGATVDSSLLGTDFSYQDMKQLLAAFGDTRPALEKPAKVGERLADVLRLDAEAGAPARYSRVLTYVDRQSCVVTRAEFHEAGVLRKELTVAPESLKRADGHWYPSDVLMRDVKEGTRTRLKVTGVSGVGDELPARLFDPTSFWRGS